MPAPKGNKYGVGRDSFKPKTYQPKEWWDKFIDYLEDRGNKVWNKKEAIKSGDMAGTVMDVPVSLPLTMESFCVYANVSMDTFRNYESKLGYEDYFDLTTRMRTIIESEQLEGATVGAYNQNIIARKLGLTDKQELDVKGISVGVDAKKKKKYK